LAFLIVLVPPRRRQITMYKLNDKIISFLPPESIEPQAKNQLENISELPFIFHHVAVMPDCHLGKGATVGSVIATKGAIIPAAVGVDVGCGMVAVKTKFFAKNLPDNLDRLRQGIERRIPLGAGAGNKKLTETAIARIEQLNAEATQDYDKVDKNWKTALGTLGSGNHFIEICLDEKDEVWVVLHSGSRGIGNRLATKHIKVAQQLMEQQSVNLKDRDLAFLTENTPEFSAYMIDLLWAQDFARLNRDEMMDRVMTELSYAFYGEDGHQSQIEKERINCHHNFTQQEEHFGNTVWITRKGAIQMRKDQRGIIPGSMGTRTYFVTGLQNPLSFNSAPHGAGRRFSRGEAKRRFTIDDLKKAMGDISFRQSKSLIDEIPQAYKDIDEVMENSRELVHVDHVLRQVVNVKGD
ncbi:MAG TPA: RtcB family protein, partial [Pyrinomonadaceae bacterium]|nr:RtcB family protein [Pyrinomonadaceae bacterium]